MEQANIKLTSGRLYGDVLRRSSVAGCILTETAYSPNLRLPKHSHEKAYFCFVLQGSFTEIYGRRSRACKRATLVFHPSDEAHSDHFHTEARCFNIQISAQCLARVREHSAMPNASADYQGGLPTHLVMRLYREFRNTDNLSPLVIEGLILEIMAESARHAVKETARIPARWLEAAREILHQNFSHHLKLQEIAEAVGVHPVHLAREFRRFHRCTVGEYVRRRRIEFACHQMVESDASISEIALACGFFDQSHFAKTFKLHTGTTPAAYRAAFRSG